MKKAEARKALEKLTLPELQKQSATRTLSRATASEDIAIFLGSAGELLVTRTRRGKIGYQVFEDTIQKDGSKQVVQKAYDDQGKLVHHDPKGGSP